ncbi:MAG: IS3 family transposase [Firmicutes bacterium]|nr:IS3 family transposase [Bacillota bacterium]
MKYALIEKHAGGLPVGKACEALSVLRTSYYRWGKAELGPRKLYDGILKTKIRDIFFEHHAIYGARKIAAVLRQRGVRCSRRHVRRLMDEAGLMSGLSASVYPHHR